MSGNMVAALALITFLGPGIAAQAPAASPTPVKATPVNAAAFVGDWDLAGEGPNGPASFTLSLSPEGQTLKAVFLRNNAPQSVGEISMVGPSLSLKVTFSSEAGEYPGTLTLTPSADKVLLHIDVGVAQLDGTAKKKIAK